MVRMNILHFLKETTELKTQDDFKEIVLVKVEAKYTAQRKLKRSRKYQTIV